MCFITYYYSPAYFGRFCDRQHGDTQEYKQYTNICTKYVIKTTRCAVVCILFVFLYDTLMTVAGVTETSC